MYEIKEAYIFETFQDGKVMWYKDSYERHCGYHGCIQGEDGRESVQNALIYPTVITNYDEKNSNGKITARCIKYRQIIKIDKKKKSADELRYWEVILKKIVKKKKRIATAFMTSSLDYAMINTRIEKVIYPEKYKKHG